MSIIYTRPDGTKFVLVSPKDRTLIVLVSLFSGMDLLMYGCMKTGMIPGYGIEINFSASQMHRANFKHPDGTPVMEPLIEITQDEYKVYRADKDTEDYVGMIDGKYFRTKTIQEVNGHDIRKAIEARYGSNIKIVVIGGPPCQQMSKLSKNGRSGESTPDDKNSKWLFEEYLRIVSELSADAAIMEQVDSFSDPIHEEVYKRFLSELKALPYNSVVKDLCSLHYGGHQLRWRKVVLMGHKRYKMDPVFPVPDLVNVKRVKDFLPHVGYFHSGHFTDAIKTANHFMPTVTSGSPAFFWDLLKTKKRVPTIDELLLCFGIKPGQYIIPSGIPKDQVKKAIGNAVCVHVAEALAKSLIDNFFRMRLDEDGFFVPLDTDPDGPDNTTTLDGASGPDIDPIPDDIIDSAIVLTEEAKNTTDISQTDVTDQVVLTSNETREIDIPFQGNERSLPHKDDIISDATALADDAGGKIVPVSIQQRSTPITTPGPTKFYESGFELWRGKSKLNGADIVAILTLRSQNVKTGDMAQLWILTADCSPLEAVQTGADEAICGSCKLRHSQDGACYVFVGQEPLIVWKAWRNDAYPKLPMKYYDQLAGLSIRFGAYGDPAAIPVDILTELKRYAKNYTGYTHQWRNEAFAELKPLCMASVDNPDEYREATEKGWRTYRVKTATDLQLPGEVLCPNITSGTQCIVCHLCSGTSHKGRNIAIPVHGSRKGKFKPVSETLTPADGNNPPIVEKIDNEVEPQVDIHLPAIITSTDLVKMEFGSLPFTSEWSDFFGEPSVNFHCAIHGIAGQGKSTFAIQFANYLSHEFGRVLYIAAEEGFERTLKDKFLNNNAASDSLHVANFRNYEHINRLVQPGYYKFIFIDSLDRLKINAQKLIMIRNRHKDAALITISQATKAGHMRGSYEIAHDSDIVVAVRNGVATTTKNRFKETGLRFEVFQQKQQLGPADNNEDDSISKTAKGQYPKRSKKDLLSELNERLKDALANEDYELAARIRDQIKKEEDTN